MAGENFCLKWNDHHNVFFSNIESLCEKSFLTDVLLSAGGQVYPAHKLVLCICSTYFQELFFKPQPASMQSSNTVIYLKDVDPTYLQLLLTYMYRGEVDVSESHLTEFLRTAAGLRVRGLTETDRSAPAPAPAPTPETVFSNKRKLETRPLVQDEVILGGKKISRDFGYVQTKTDEIVINENPTTSDIKEESDEPSTTWTSVSKENINTNREEDYPVEMTNYQTDLTGYEDDKDHYGGKIDKFPEDPTLMTDKLNKAYQCEMCSMSFNQKWLLRRHWKTHTGAKPYKCTVCARTFSLRDSCTRHIRTVHRDVVDVTKDNVNTLVDVTDPDFEPNNVMTVQYNE